MAMKRTAALACMLQAAQCAQLRTERKPSNSSNITVDEGTKDDEGASRGVVYAVTGDARYWDEMENSALRLHTNNITVFTGALPEDMETCKNKFRIRGWSCVDAKAAAGETPSSFGEVAKAYWERGKRSTKADSRLIKLSSMAQSPYDHTLFLDTDTVPCYGLDSILSLLSDEVGDHPGMFSAYDIMIAENRVGNGFYRNASKDGLQEWFHKQGVPASFTEVNSGVIFLASKRPAVQTLLTNWLSEYIESLHEPAGSLGQRGRGDASIPGDQIALRVSLWHSVQDGLRLYRLPAMYNFKNWRAIYTDAAYATERSSKAANQPAGSLQNCCVSEEKSPLIIDHACGAAYSLPSEFLNDAP